MEMTPGQIMEAEISATLFEEDEAVSGGGQISTSIKDPTSEEVTSLGSSESSALPENLFTSDTPGILNRPPAIMEESDDDVATIVNNKRKRKQSGSPALTGSTVLPDGEQQNSKRPKPNALQNRQRNRSSGNSAIVRTPVGINNHHEASQQNRSIKNN